MTKNKPLSPELQEIIAGQNEAVQLLPADHAERVALLDKEKKIREDMNDKIAQAKKDAGHASYLERLTTNHGISPQAIKINNILDGMPARARAATIRHVLTRAEDKNWIVPDMFDSAFGSIKPGDEDPAVYDSTGTGKAQGGENAQPRTPEEMAASHEPKGTGPGLSYEEIVAGFTKAEEAWKANGSKPGRKPKDYVEAKAALDAANAERANAEAETAPEPAAPEPTKPDNVVSFTEQQRRANAKGEEHIKQQSEKKAAERAGKATTAREEKKPRAKKAEAAPEANPALADDEDEEAPAAAPPPGQIGTAPATFRMG